MSTESQCCKNCRYWHSETGQCRAHPPQLDFHPEAHIVSTWPTSQWGQWCGEWRDAVYDKQVPETAP